MNKKRVFAFATIIVGLYYGEALCGIGCPELYDPDHTAKDLNECGQKCIEWHMKNHHVSEEEAMNTCGAGGGQG